MGKRGFKELLVWQKAKALAVSIYRLTESGKISQDFGLRDQMRRAAVSVCSNIAEGDERNSDKDSTRFFCIAKGSLAELVTQLEIALEIEYINSENTNEIGKECEEIGKMLGALIKARRNGKL
jgi:four helix bundle protein